MIGLHSAPLDTHPRSVTPAPPPAPPCDPHCARVTCPPRLQARVTRVQVISYHAEPGGLETPDVWREGGNY